MPRYKILVTVKAAFSQYFVTAYNGKDMVFATREEAELKAAGYNIWYPARRYTVVEAA